MWNRPSTTILCASALWLGLAGLPAQAAETRVKDFTLTCDSTIRNIVFTVTGFAASVTRLVQGAAVAVYRPQGGLKFLRLEAAGDPTKTFLVMGLNEVSARVDLTGFIPVSTTASGNVAVQIIAACTGGGTLQGTAVIYFF